jgi:hypothetical protein
MKGGIENVKRQCRHAIELYSVKKQLAAKDKEIERLRKALEFYEAGNEWDYGHQARKALEQKL